MSGRDPAPSDPAAPARTPPLSAGAFFERFGAPVALLALCILTALLSDSFLKPENLFNILRQVSFTGIVAIGMTIVIIGGGIDLSVGAMLAFVGGVSVLVFNRLLGANLGGVMSPNGPLVAPNLAVAIAALVALSSGILLGLLNGLLITYGRITPFIVTLGGLAAYRSLALAIADGGEYRSANRAVFEPLGGGGIPIPGIDVAPNVPLLLPYPVLAFAAVALAAHVLLARTAFGRHVYAVGCNEKAALYSAVNVRRVKILTYTLTGACVGLAALLLASRMNAVSSGQTGSLLELDAIAAVVIGGTAMSGGRGGIIGTVVGVMLLGVVNNMLNLLQVNSYLQGLVKGFIIVFAVLLQRGGRST